MLITTWAVPDVVVEPEELELEVVVEEEEEEPPHWLEEEEEEDFVDFDASWLEV